MIKKWMIAVTLFAGVGLTVQATSISDTVESDEGWANINGGFFSASLGGLVPEAGTKFWSASGGLRGASKVFSSTFTSNDQLEVSYSLGDRNDTAFPASVTAYLFADVNNDDAYQWTERITDTAIQTRPGPDDGWAVWKDTYSIAADTQTANGDSVIGKKIGFFVFADMVSGEALSFDNLVIQTSPAQSNPGTLLIGWGGESGASWATNMSGISGAAWVDAISSVDATAGSTDGTYGIAVAGADTAATAYAVRTASPGENDTLTVKVENNTGNDVTLDKLVFDYGRWFEDAPKDIIVKYAYGQLNMTNGTVVEVVSGISVTAKLGDYTDVFVSLSGLEDNILADGESASFQLVASNANGLYNNGALDNIAFLGVAQELSGYAGWIVDFDLSDGQDASTADPDGDGINNLYEYGLGGDPTNSTVTGTLPLFEITDQGGSNVCRYIHVQRTDAQSGISYSVQQTPGLVSAVWTNDGFTVTGESGDVGGFKTVTNQTPADAASKFVKLVISEQ